MHGKGPLTAVPVQPAGDRARGKMELQFPEMRLALSSPADEHPDTDRDGEKQCDGAKHDADDDAIFRCPAMRLRLSGRTLGSVRTTLAEPQVVKDVWLVLRRCGDVDGQVMKTGAQYIPGVE